MAQAQRQGQPQLQAQAQHVDPAAQAGRVASKSVKLVKKRHREPWSRKRDVKQLFKLISDML